MEYDPIQVKSFTQIYFVFVVKWANFVIINRLRIISQAQSIQTNEEIINYLRHRTNDVKLYDF